MNTNKSKIARSYLQRLADKLQSESTSSLPSLSTKSSESHKAQFVPKRRKLNHNPFAKNGSSKVRKFSSRRKKSVVSNQFNTINQIEPQWQPVKRKSAEYQVEPLTEEDELRCEFTHAFFIAKTRLVVEKAKAARFSGLRSPRALNTKASQFGFSDEKRSEMQNLNGSTQIQKPTSINKQTGSKMTRNTVAKSIDKYYTPRAKKWSRDQPLDIIVSNF